MQNKKTAFHQNWTFNVILLSSFFGNAQIIPGHFITTNKRWKCTLDVTQIMLELQWKFASKMCEVSKLWSTAASLITSKFVCHVWLKMSSTLLLKLILVGNIGSYQIQQHFREKHLTKVLFISKTKWYFNLCCLKQKN